ncbi:MAG: hypothetical protein QXZ13_01755 [Candidatus Diapherotrites archaeon]
MKKKNKSNVPTDRALTDKRSESALAYVIAVVFFLIFLVVFLSFLFDLVFPGPKMMRFHFARNFDLGLLESFSIISVFLNTINSFLLIYLLYNYITIYLNLKSKFALGLIVIASALFAQSVSANPLVAQFFGFRGFGLGPFALIPSIFTLVASLVLIYLSRQ